MTQPVFPSPGTATSPPIPGAPNDRLRTIVQRLLDAMLPFIAYYVPWECTVIGVTPGSPGTPTTVSAVPVDVARCPFTTLANIPVWPGSGGSPCIPAPGSVVLVRFNDGNPGKPAICSVDPTIPAPIPDVPGSKISVAGLLATFALACSASTDGTLVAASNTLKTALEPLL